MGSIRHFTINEVNGNKVDIGIANIKDSQSPIDAAKKLLSSYCRDKNIKSNQRNKVNIIFTIRETTRGHSKIYGPYKGYFVKYDKPVIIKLKNGKVIKKTLKPVVKLDDVVQKGGDNNLPEEEKNLRKLVKDIKDGKKNSNELNSFDVSRIKDMSYLFKDFNFKNNCDISKWDVRNLTDMSHMFDGSNFNQNLNDWDNYFKINKNSYFRMDYMFNNCIELDQPFLWNLSNETSLINMFAYSTKLFQRIEKSESRIFGNKEKHFKLKDNININFKPKGQKNTQKYNPKYIIEESGKWILYNKENKINELNPPIKNNVNSCLNAINNNKNVKTALRMCDHIVMFKSVKK